MSSKKPTLTPEIERALRNNLKGEALIVALSAFAPVDPKPRPVVYIIDSSPHTDIEGVARAFRVAAYFADLGSVPIRASSVVGIAAHVARGLHADELRQELCYGGENHIGLAEFLGIAESTNLITLAVITQPDGSLSDTAWREIDGFHESEEMPEGVKLAPDGKTITRIVQRPVAWDKMIAEHFNERYDRDESSHWNDVCDRSFNLARVLHDLVLDGVV